MKTLNRIAILVLATLMLLVSLTGCQLFGKNNGDSGNGNGGTTPNEPIIADTENYLIKEGASDYKIVYENDVADAKGYEALAANEIKQNIKLASNVDLSVVQASEVTVNASSKLIILGDNSLSAAANVKADKNTFGVRGFVIKTIDSNVYIVGGDPMGTLYGAYEFLHYQFGYEPYASDEIALEKGVLNKKLMDFNLEEIPDIAHVQATFDYWNAVNKSERRLPGHRMRFNDYDEIFTAGDDQPWHNTFAMYVDPNEYYDEHPKWYIGPPGSSNNQLHYTAHGDKAELQALEDTVYEKMVAYIDSDAAKGKEYTMIGFMAQDGTGWASEDAYDGDGVGTVYDEQGNIIDDDEVDSVAEYKKKYGDAYAAAMLIHFINPLQERITAYMNENYDGRKMQITIFAYVDAQTPPTKMENGKLVPIDKSVVLHEDVNVFIAPIYADYLNDFEDSGVKDLTDGWEVIASNTSYWFYEYFFSTSNMTHLDSTYSMQSFFQACHELGGQYIFYETPLNPNEYYVFGRLKLYLISKFGWDVNADVNELIDGFFKNYYKEAAEPMRQYFDSLTAYCALLREQDNPKMSGVCGGSGIDDARYWKQSVLEQWVYLMDKAYEAIEPVKNTDKDLYNTLYNRILYDSLSPRFLLLKHYAKEAFTDTTFNEEWTQFKLDAKALGVTHWRATGAKPHTFEELTLTR